MKQNRVNQTPLSPPPSAIVDAPATSSFFETTQRPRHDGWNAEENATFQTLPEAETGTSSRLRSDFQAAAAAPVRQCEH